MAQTKKEYQVFIDLTISTHVYVEATSEEEATRIVNEKFNADPYWTDFPNDAYVSHEVTSAEVDEY